MWVVVWPGVLCVDAEVFVVVFIKLIDAVAYTDAEKPIVGDDLEGIFGDFEADVFLSFCCGFYNGVGEPFVVVS